MIIHDKYVEDDVNPDDSIQQIIDEIDNTNQEDEDSKVEQENITYYNETDTNKSNNQIRTLPRIIPMTKQYEPSFEGRTHGNGRVSRSYLRW